jgi:predicted phosphodiesterase
LIKLAALFDVHYPYNIKLNPILNFLSDFKPDVIKLPGDILDLAYLSHWNELSPGKWAGKNLRRDYDEMGNILDQIQSKIKPKKMYYFIGNHELWVKQFMDKFPFLEGVLDVPEGLHLKERGIELVPYNKSTKVGHLYFMHGMYVNEGHAAKTVKTFQRCMRYGHTHDHQVFSIISPLDYKLVYNAMSCGCLCNRNAEYMHGKPNKWQHGFYVAYVWPNGNFTDYFIPIINNRFVWNGKMYE